MCQRTGERDQSASLSGGGRGDLSIDTNHHRRANIFFNITSPTPGTFIIALHFKGREKPILEMDLKIDDLLEKVRIGQVKKDCC